MIKKMQYNTIEDREEIIANNSTMFLIEEQNTIEGDFLIFTDEKPLSKEVKDLKQSIAELSAIIATMMTP